VESGYVYNFNRVTRSVANANQGLSVIQSRDLTIEGRAFDVHHTSFALSLAEIEIEKVPERGGVGFKIDLATGDVQDIIVDSIKAVSPKGVSDFDKVFQHASISYLAPVGTGLRVDFGKFVTHIGGETIESIKNRNFSHSFFYTYAIPFQDSGIRLNYAFNSKVYAEAYVLNGWNVTSDNNSGKTYGASIGLTPNSKLSVYANYLGGPERNDNNDDWRHLGDFQIVYSPTKTFSTMVNIDVGKDINAVGPRKDATWGGIALYARKSFKDRFFPTARVEYYNDPDGFSTGVKQHLWGYTLTGDYKLGGEGSFAHVMFRPEIRYDRSNAKFFSHGDDFRSRRNQFTAGVGLVVYF
ncbi:MAG: outer membrane beta-barrel protein, partial [Blastocatellia bacterium]